MVSSPWRFSSGAKLKNFGKTDNLRITQTEVPSRAWGDIDIPKRELGNEPFMFQENTQNHENYCRVRSLHQFWRVRRALGQTFSEQSLMSPGLMSDCGKAIRKRGLSSLHVPVSSS
jgi:hypothetical protein